MHWSLTLRGEALQESQLVKLELQAWPGEAVVSFRQLLGMLLGPQQGWLHVLLPQLRSTYRVRPVHGLGQ